MKTISKLSIALAVLASAFALTRAGEPQGPRTVMVDSSGVLYAPTNFFDTNATAIATALAPWLGAGGGYTYLFSVNQFEAVSVTNIFIKSGAYITNAVLRGTPTITDWTQATHPHTTDGTGGTLSGEAITSGTVAAARIDSTIATDAEVTAAVSSAIASAAPNYQPANQHLSNYVVAPFTNSANLASSILDETGVGKAVFNTNAVLEAPYIGNLANMQHNHSTAQTGSQLGASALNPVEEYTLGIVHAQYGLTADTVTGTNGVSDSIGDLRDGFLATATIIVDPIGGSDVTGTRGVSDRPFATLAGALSSITNNDVVVMRPGTNSVTAPGMPSNSSAYSEHTNAVYVLKNLTNVTVIGYGASIEWTGLGNILSIVDSERITIEGLRFGGPGWNAAITAQICGAIVQWGTNQNVTVRNCSFENIPNHAVLVSQLEKASLNARVENCWFQNIGTTNHTALGIDGTCVASLGPGGVIVGNRGTNVVRGIEYEGSGSLPKGSVTIADNEFTGIINQGIIIIETSAIGTNSNDYIVSGNKLIMDHNPWTASGQYGISFSGGRRGRISNNTVWGANNTGCVLSSSQGDMRSMIVTGNNFAYNGVNFAITDPGGWINYDNAVIGNVMTGNTSASGNVILSGNATLFFGNTVSDSTGWGVYAQPPTGGGGSTNITIAGNLIRTPEYHAIAIAAGCYGTVIHANNLTYATSKISDGGTGTLINTYDDATITDSLTVGGTLDVSGDTDITALLTANDILSRDTINGSEITATNSITTSNLTSTANTTVSNLTASGTVTAPDYNYSGGSVADAIGANAAALAALPSQSIGYFTGNGTNNAEATYSDLRLTGGVSTWMLDIEGGTATLDLDASGGFNVIATNATLDIAYSNEPDTTGRRKAWPIAITNAAGETVTITWGSASPGSEIGYTTIETDKYAHVTLISHDNVLRYYYTGPQVPQLPESGGGTATTNGMAVAPRHVLYYPQVVSQGTNFNAELSKATSFQSWMSTNMHILASDGRPTTTNLMTEAYWLFINNSGSDYTLSIRSEFQDPDGLFPMTVTNGTTARVLVQARGPYETNVWVMVDSVGTYAGGGSPPSSSLNTGLIAHYKFNETSGTTVSNALGGSIGAMTFAAAGWTKTATGPDGNSWSNSVVTAYSTNWSAGLELGQGADDGCTFNIWLYPFEINSKYVMGRWYHSSTDANKEYAWVLQHDGSGGLDAYVSSNGTNSTANVNSTFTSTTGARHMYSFMFDDANDLIGVSLDGGAWQTAAFTGTLFDADTPFAIAGAYYTETWSGLRAQYDELGVWNRPLTSAEIAELYAAGAGKFPDNDGNYSP